MITSRKLSDIYFKKMLFPLEKKGKPFIIY